MRLGGIDKRRQIDPHDLFEVTVDRLFRDAMTADEAIARIVWHSLADVRWVHEGDDLLVWYSPRAAGDLVAAVIGSGNFRNWYRPELGRLVHPMVANAMAAEGWTWRLPPVE